MSEPANSLKWSNSSYSQNWRSSARAEGKAASSSLAHTNNTLPFIGNSSALGRRGAHERTVNGNVGVPQNSFDNEAPYQGQSYRTRPPSETRISDSEKNGRSQHNTDIIPQPGTEAPMNLPSGRDPQHIPGWMRGTEEAIRITNIQERIRAEQEATLLTTSALSHNTPGLPLVTTTSRADSQSPGWAGRPPTYYSCPSQGLRSAPATASFINDLDRVSYPDSIKDDDAGPNTNPRKSRKYEHDHLQYAPIYEDKPESTSRLDTFRINREHPSIHSFNNARISSNKAMAPSWHRLEVEKKGVDEETLEEERQRVEREAEDEARWIREAEGAEEAETVREGLSLTEMPDGEPIVVKVGLPSKLAVKAERLTLLGTGPNEGAKKGDLPNDASGPTISLEILAKSMANMEAQLSLALKSLGDTQTRLATVERALVGTQADVASGQRGVADLRIHLSAIQESADATKKQLYSFDHHINGVDAKANALSKSFEQHQNILVAIHETIGGTHQALSGMGSSIDAMRQQLFEINGIVPTSRAKSNNEAAPTHSPEDRSPAPANSADYVPESAAPSEQTVLSHSPAPLAKIPSSPSRLNSTPLGHASSDTLRQVVALLDQRTPTLGAEPAFGRTVGSRVSVHKYIQTSQLQLTGLNGRVPALGERVLQGSGDWRNSFGKSYSYLSSLLERG